MSTVFNCCNLAIFLAIVVGTFMHHRRTFHVRMMVGCFVADVALLLAVELTRDAVAQAAEGVSTADWLLIVHISFSVAMLVLWGLQIVLGRRVLKGRMEVLPAHKRCARFFLFCRLGNLVTAFMV